MEKIILKGKREAVVISWQNMFNPPISLEAPSRYLMRHGPLRKAQAGVTGRGTVTYYFLLFNDLLVYATSQNGQYTLRKSLSIHGSLQITDLPEEKGIKKPKMAIQLDWREPEKTLILLFKDLHEKECWLRDFREARKQMALKKGGKSQHEGTKKSSKNKVSDVT